MHNHPAELPVTRELRASAEAVRGHLRAGFLHAGRELSRAKLTCEHGEWLPYLELCAVPVRCAQRMMRAAKAVDAGEVPEDLSLRATLAMPWPIRDQTCRICRRRRTADPEPVPVPVETVPAKAATLQDDPDPDPEPREPRPTMRDKLTGAAAQIAAHGREVFGKDQDIDDLRQQVRLLNDADRPDAAARIQELAKSQAQARAYRSGMMEWQQKYEDERRRAAFFVKVLKRHGLADARGRVVSE